MRAIGRIALLALGAVAAGGILVSVSSGQVVVPQPTFSPDPPLWTKDTATFEFSSPGAVSFTCRLDSGAEEACTSPKVYSQLPNGAHTFEVRAGEPPDVSDWTRFDWMVDDTPPSLPGNIVTEATSPSGAIVVFEASDNLDPSPLLDCGANSSGSAFPLGVTTVSCTATDAAGNESQGLFTVTVEDSTPPALAPHQDVIRPQQSSQGAVVNYQLPDAQDIADPSPTVQCQPPPGSQFPIGETEVTCTATDAAGGTSQPTTFRVIVQQGAVPAKPGITASVGQLTNSSEVAFQLDLEPGVAAECSLDGPLGAGAFAPCSTGTTQTYEDLVDGAYLFTVQVTNAVGNVNQSNFAWTVDLTGPAEVARFSGRVGPRVVRLSWTKPIDVDYDRVRIWRKRPSASAWTRLGDRVGGSSFTDRGVSNHVRYLYRIRSLDILGNVSAAEHLSAWPTPIIWPWYDSIVHSPPLVDWSSVKKATYYNLQVWRDGRKLLSAWPLGSQYRLRSTWRFQGAQRALSGGKVTVYVWPGFGPKAQARYGSLYGQTRFALG